MINRWLPVAIINRCHVIILSVRMRRTERNVQETPLNLQYSKLNPEDNKQKYH